MSRKTVVTLLSIVGTIAVLVVVGVILATRQSIAVANESFDLAENLAEESEWKSVVDVLTGLEPVTPELRERRLVLLGQAHAALGEDEEAAAQWRELFQESRDPRVRGRALLDVVAAEIRMGELDAAEDLLGGFRDLAAPGLNDRHLFTRALLLEAQGEEEEAAEALADARERYGDSELADEIEDRLGRINLALLFSRQPQEGDELHAIESGDTLESLGRRYEVSPSLIQRINGISDPRRLRVGHRIKIPRNSFRIEVYKDEFRVCVFDDGKFFARYPCRIGRLDYMTPEESYHIQTRTVDPTWTDPAGRIIAAGERENELGTRWMGFKENPSLGIHGTIHPETIGSAASNGCIGLLREDVEELFDLIPRGTEVRIYRSRTQAERERSDV
jgi:tetratricopeptide (TPR) repeat protein